MIIHPYTLSMPNFESAPDNREQLKAKKLSLEQISALSEAHPEMKDVLEKAVAVALARFGDEAIIPIVEGWPDAVIADGHVDITASLYKKIQANGIAGVDGISGSLELTAMHVIRGAEPTQMGPALEKLLLASALAHLSE